MKKKSIAGIWMIMALGLHLEGQVGGSLRADMYTIPVAEETGMASARLSWSVENSVESVISIDSTGLENDFITGAESGTAIAPWIREGRIYIFRLYAREGETRTLLDSVSVSGTRPLPKSSIGLNAFPLFAQYLGISQRNNDYQNERHRKVSRAMAHKSIIAASEMGTTYLRVMVSGFFSPTLDVLKNDPSAFWAAMDELMAEFKANGMKIIPSLGWNIYQFPDYFGETISDFIGNPNSQSYLFYIQFISDFVSRYKDHEVVLFYELGNEYNLHADLVPSHSFNEEPYTGKFSTAELSDFQKRTACHIRSLDPAGMVGSGNSTPRPSAYHLMLQPAFSAEGPDWTPDSFDEFKKYVKILEEGVDIVSMHMYNGAPGNHQRFGISGENSAEIAGYMKEAVDEAGKLLFLGEFGDRDPHVSVDTNAVFTRNMFNKITELDIPFSAPWIWEFYQFNTYEKNEFTIEQGFTDLLIEKYKEANVNMGNDAVVFTDPDTVKPQVVITYPIGADEFARPSQLVHAVASDNSGSIAKVEFWVNGELANTDTEPPYRFDLNTGGLSMNSTEIVARAYDESGNTADYMLEANPEILIATGTLTANPDTVTIFEENSGGNMVGSVNLSWSASGEDNVFLYVKMDQNETKLVAQGSANSSQSVEWIQDGHSYVFYLSSVAGDLAPPALLDTVLVIGQKEAEPPVTKIIMPVVFSDGMVLQRDMPIRIFGEAPDSAMIIVRLNGQEKTTLCLDGRWMLNLDAMPAGGPYELFISGENDEITYIDVMIGEVWVAGGQSNMAFGLAATANFEEHLPVAENPQLRFMQIPVTEFGEIIRDGLQWNNFDPQSVRNFSAVACFFATELQKRLGVCVGIIGSYRGGTWNENWMTPASIQNEPELKYLFDNYETEYAKFENEAAYEEAYQQFLAELEVWQDNGGWASGPRPMAPMGPKAYQRPSGLYETMIEPLQPYTIKGCIWYQGEGNSDRYEEFRTLFPAFIQGWRETWQNPDLPFYFVQLPGYGKGLTWPQFRQAQFDCWQDIEHCGMVVSEGCGDENDIHPKVKKPIGDRLAIAASAELYGQDHIPYGPTYRSVEFLDGKAHILFDHTGSGLVLSKENSASFEIAGEDKIFQEAGVEINGNELLLWNEAIGDPRYVRYAYRPYPEMVLFNQEGLPASPFANLFGSSYEIPLPATGTITANPDTVTIFEENSAGLMEGSVDLSWSASGIDIVFLYVRMDEKEAQLVAQGPANSSKTLGWIGDGHSYVFYLSSEADDLTPPALLDTVLVIGQKKADPLSVNGTASRPHISNYPNPFQNRTLIRVEGLEVASASGARMEIFDILGNLRETIPLNGHTGVYEFSREGYASGLYYCRLVGKGKTLSVNKMVLK